jgi:hypothetical protein
MQSYDEGRRIVADGHIDGSNATNTAHRSIIDQHEAQPHRPISLDALWRACGEPEGKSPPAWLDLAKGLIRGIEDYAEQVHGEPSDVPEHPYTPGLIVFRPTSHQVVRDMNGDALPSPYLHGGDITACHEVAVLYAMYLDNHGLMNLFVDQGGSD